MLRCRWSHARKREEHEYFKARFDQWFRYCTKFAIMIHTTDLLSLVSKIALPSMQKMQDTSKNEKVAKPD